MNYTLLYLPLKGTICKELEGSLFLLLTTALTTLPAVSYVILGCVNYLWL